MADAGDPVQRREEGVPAAALVVEDFLAGGGEAVEAAAARARLLDPAALDEAAALEAIERRVERGDMELQGASRPCVDQLGDLIAVAIALLEEGEDQGFGAALAQLAVGAGFWVRPRFGVWVLGSGFRAVLGSGRFVVRGFIVQRFAGSAEPKNQ
jgi:hypothetical protein